MPDSNANLPSGYNEFVGSNKSANRTYYLPYAGDYEVGEEIRVLNSNSNDSYLYPRSGDTIQGAAVHINLVDTWQSVCLKSDGVSNWIIIWLGGQFA